MELDLPGSAAEFIEEQVRRGIFSTPQDVVVAALQTFRADCEFGDFAPGELNALLEEGERSGNDQGWYAADEARRELAARLSRRTTRP